jgi:hypothetical protein
MAATGQPNPLSAARQRRMSHNTDRRECQTTGSIRRDRLPQQAGSYWPRRDRARSTSHAQNVGMVQFATPPSSSDREYQRHTDSYARARRTRPLLDIDGFAVRLA